MGNQINTQPQTFKTNTVVMGSAAGLSAVSGLTVYGDISASGTFYGVGAVPISTSHTFNGSVASFTVNGYTGTTATNYLAYLDGVHQIPGTDYTVASSGSITFTPTPVSGVVANVIAFQSSINMLSLSGIEPLVSTYTGTGAQTAFVVGVSGGFTNTTAASYLVIIGGLVQRPGIDYTVSSASGGTINFTAAPPSGASIVVFAYQTMPSAQGAFVAANELAASKIDKPSTPSAGQVLSYNGSAWVAGSSITSGTAVALTSQTSVDFTGIPSTAKRITVMFNGVSVSGTSGFLIQLGTSAGVVTSGYNSTISIATTQTTSTAGILVQGGGNVNTYTHIGTLVLSNFSGNIWVGTAITSPGNLSNSASFGAGSISLASTLDRVRLTTVNGTDLLDAGTVNIMWE